jgi:hypothetical protein
LNAAPKRRADLDIHDCILQSYMAQPNVWRLIAGDDAVDAA